MRSWSKWTLAVVLALAVLPATTEDTAMQQQNPAIVKAMAAVDDAAAKAATDPARPVYHFRPRAQWMNDPNGPIYYRGYYHLFYQHNPYGDQWGHMHWGHARSKDLVHWEHLPIALWPSEERGEEHCFSGCAALTQQGRPILFYTSIGKRLPEQWAAVPADDDLIAWTKHPQNPILTESAHGNVKVYEWRDPFVFQHDGACYMVAGGNLNETKGGQAVVNLYKASDPGLAQWQYRGVLFQHPDADAKNIECPNFFELDGKWVLVVSPHRPVEYFTGAFDATAGKFHSQQRGTVDYGAYYAPNCLLDPKGRRIMWGWINGFPPDRGWNGCLTLPRILSLDSEGRIIQQPAPELQSLRGAHTHLAGLPLGNGERVLDGVRGDTLEIVAEFEPKDAQSFGLRLRRSDDGARTVNVVCDGEMIDVAGAKAPYHSATNSKTVTLQVFADKSVLEVYVNGGRTCITRVISAPQNDLAVAAFAEHGAADLKSLDAWPLAPIW